MVNTNSVLSSILFSQTIDWNIKQFFSSTSINSSFELKRIGKAITRRKDQMVVEDDKRYKRITIKTNCGGVFVRDEVLGKDIKTKKQYYVKAGQLAVSKIDARNGAFGIVPPEADGAIITGNFWVYDVNPEIANIDYLILDDDITVEQLSEGEKKLILVKTVLEILSDEKTLVLMDEPDAHLHEGRKPALCNMMREYPNRQIVIATHSPIMAQIANEKELLMLELENGKSTILTDEKIEKIKKLSGTSWDVIGQGMMLRSSRPLVVFEGKTDVMYVKRALEMLKSRVTDYASLNVDFLNANGAGNVKSFIDNLKAFVPDSKKIVVFFDRDNAGKDGVQAITGISKNDGRVAHYQDIVQDNITTSFIPYKDGVTEGDFLIEDYFSWDDTIKAIVEDVIPDRKHPIKMLPNLPDKIKKELEKRINKFEADEFNGFIPLLDKIVELTKEQAV